MKSTKFLLILFIVFLTVSLLFSCKKRKDMYRDTSSDNALAETFFNDIYNQVDNAVKSSPQANGRVKGGSCPVITITPADTISFPKVITIDFGDGCVGIGGRTRTGKIICNMSGRYKNPGTVISISLDNYTVNGNKIEGTKTVTNTGRNTSGNLVYSIEVTNAKIITEDGTITWNSSRKREWIAGENTPYPNLTDDVYLITGNANGTNRSGNKFTMEIIKPLRVELSCKNIVSGIIKLKPENLPERELDYGDGTCDDIAILKIKNKTYTIRLR